jgi:hypothetical protein
MRQDTLRRRVAALETKLAARRAPAAEERPHVDRGELAGRLALLAAGYSDWRHEALTLEELLAVAHDDATRPDAPRWATNAKDAAREIANCIANAKAAAREIEIRIGLRDGLIDKEAANELREHLRADPLPELTYVVTMDHDAALASARAKCPRREDLPIETQLAMLEEDREHELREERERRATRQPGAVEMPPREPLIERIYEWRVRELRSRL